MLHELLSNRRLFRGANDLNTLARVRAMTVSKPSVDNPEVTAKLDEICLKALARDPRERFASCGELAIALYDIVQETQWGPERMASLVCETPAVPEGVDRS
jgi:serine/threonine-protein kinase